MFGYSMLVSSAITLLTPAAASLGFTLVAALRVLLGFCLVNIYDNYCMCDCKCNN